MEKKGKKLKHCQKLEFGPKLCRPDKWGKRQLSPTSSDVFAMFYKTNVRI